MQTKLTLRLEKSLIDAAKTEADRRGTSLSRLVADFFRSLTAVGGPGESQVLREETGRATDLGVGPRTRRLLGVLREDDVDPEAYRKHLENKHLR
ncbi:MAG: antitoxin [Akkermansiaceae bacterium]|nr:antitoxin [Akkermansiaceae bacterium]